VGTLVRRTGQTLLIVALGIMLFNPFGIVDRMSEQLPGWATRKDPAALLVGAVLVAAIIAATEYCASRRERRQRRNNH
jgi:hypothetical protein